MENQDQPEDGIETEVPRVRAKRLTRAERPQYLNNEEFEEEVWLVLEFSMYQNKFQTTRLSQLPVTHMPSKPMLHNTMHATLTY